jgi:pimeloyl-ACP methyl ester carboxylesterase
MPNVTSPPLLLVMGLGAQMVAWDPEFCAQLAARGHYVVRFDNRDVGLSTKIEAGGVPDMAAVFAARQRGETVAAPYNLSDMSDDAFGLMSALGIRSAHIAGASMGGMIVQTMAIEHPERVLTMTSIMSTTGAADLPASTPEAAAALLTPAPADRAGFIEHRVKNSAVIGSAAHLRDDARVRAMAAEGFDRCFYPVGIARQLAAVAASGSRREALGAVRVPTLVIHGEIDPLVPLSGGEDTHKSIPGSELLVIPGMGHDLPKAVWPQVVPAIAKHTSRVAVG